MYHDIEWVIGILEFDLRTKYYEEIVEESDGFVVDEPNDDTGYQFNIWDYVSGVDA